MSTPRKPTYQAMRVAEHISATATPEVFRCHSPEREWIEMQRLAAALAAVSPEAIGSYLDGAWGDWRNGNPDTDYILYPDGDDCHMIGSDPLGKPGFLDIDGERFYSAAWL